MSSQKKALPTLSGSRTRVRKRNIKQVIDPEKFKENLDELLSTCDTVQDVFAVITNDSNDINYKQYYEQLLDRLIAGDIGICLGRVDARKPVNKLSFLGSYENSLTSELDEWKSQLETYIKTRPFFCDILNELFTKTFSGLEIVPQHINGLVHIAAWAVSRKLVKYSSPRVRDDIFLLNITRISSLVDSGVAAYVLVTFCREYLSIVNSEDETWKLVCESSIAAKLEEFFPRICHLDFPKCLEAASENENQYGIAKDFTYDMKWLSVRYVSAATELAITEHEHEITNIIVRSRRNDIEEEDTSSENSNFDDEECSGEEEIESEIGGDEKMKEDKFTEVCSTINSYISQISQSQHANVKIETSDIVQLLWRAIILSANLRNQAPEIVAYIKKWSVLIVPIVHDDLKLEATLMSSIQETCYENAKLLPVFKDIIVAMMQLKAINPDVVIAWYKNGQTGSGRMYFNGQMSSLVELLDQAEDDYYDYDYSYDEEEN